VLVAVATGATTTTLTVNGSPVGVELVRPYVIFWSALGSLAAAGLGGVGGGLVPRRRQPVYETVTGGADVSWASEPAGGNRSRGAIAG
jgi:hypothetical protein